MRYTPVRHIPPIVSVYFPIFPLAYLPIYHILPILHLYLTRFPPRYPATYPVFPITPPNRHIPPNLFIYLLFFAFYYMSPNPTSPIIYVYLPYYPYTICLSTFFSIGFAPIGFVVSLGIGLIPPTRPLFSVSLLGFSYWVIPICWASLNFPLSVSLSQLP